MDKTSLSQLQLLSDQANLNSAFTKQLSHEQLQSLLPPEYQLVGAQEFTQSLGETNDIFFLSTNKGDLVLRVIGLHLFYTGILTLNYIESTKLIEQHTSVPLPKVIAFDLTTNNLLEREYIIVERLKGMILTEYFRTLVNEGDYSYQIDKIKRIGSQILGFVKEMQQIPIHNKVGSFGKNGEAIPPALDGPPLGPFDSNSQLLIALSHWTLNCWKTTSYIPAELQLALSKVLQALYEGVYRAWDSVIVFNHDDLNENNIIVDKEGTVVGILDWDQTIARVPGLDVRPYEEWFDEIPDERMQDELREWFSNELIQRGVIHTNDPRQYSILRFVYDCVLTVFWPFNKFRNCTNEERLVKLSIFRQKQVKQCLDRVAQGHLGI